MNISHLTCKCEHAWYVCFRNAKSKKQMRKDKKASNSSSSTEQVRKAPPLTRKEIIPKPLGFEGEEKKVLQKEKNSDTKIYIFSKALPTVACRSYLTVD